MYDEWIDDDPANGGLALTRLRAAAGRSPVATLRRVLEAHSATPRRSAWPSVSPTSRSRAPARRSPARGPRGAGGAGTSRAGGNTHERTQDERTRRGRAAAWVARDGLERHGVGAPADEELLAILVGANGAHTAGALLAACRQERWTRASSIPGRSSGRPRRAARLPSCPSTTTRTG